MKAPNDRRHYARWFALQKLFCIHFPDNASDPVGEYDSAELLEIDGINEYDSSLAESIINGVRTNREAIDAVIGKLAPERPISQMSKLEVEILRIAIFEGFIGKITPEKVAIDEAIELAKNFGTNTSRLFVSGVLGTLIEKNQQLLSKS